MIATIQCPSCGMRGFRKRSPSDDCQKCGIPGELVWCNCGGPLETFGDEMCPPCADEELDALRDAAS